MREVCQASGGEAHSEFSLNPPSSPAVLMHWRALIELLGLKPAPTGHVMQSPVPCDQVVGSPVGPPAVSSVVDRPEVPMDCVPGRMVSGEQSGLRILDRGRGARPKILATGVRKISTPRPVPLLSLSPVPSFHLLWVSRGLP